MSRGHPGSAAARLAAAALIATVLPAARAIAQQESDHVAGEQGKAIYAEKCSHCHGPGMLNAGTITPDLRKFAGDQKRFVTTVKQGKNGKMPPWGDLLSDDQIASLWAYISSQRKP